MKREEFLKLKVGDKVKIVNKRPEHRDGGMYFNPDMSKWLGKVMTVKELKFGHSIESCVTLEDCYWGSDPSNAWQWSAHMIERKIEEKKPDILRVRCVENAGSPNLWTVGKVYERVGGVLTDNIGYGWKNLCRNDDPKYWGFSGYKFELADSKERYPQIIIKQDGNTVTAYCGSAKGVAQCSPDDTFDLYTGAQLALARAFGREEKKDEESLYPKIGWDGIRRRIMKGFEEDTKNMYKLADDIERASKKEEPKKPKNLKVKCTYADKDGKDFIEGKVYERVDGKLESERRFTYYALCKSDDPTEWEFGGEFGHPCYKFELYEEPKKIKVRCVEGTGSAFTVGKIYEWVDGRMTDEYGYTFTSLCCSSDPSKWLFLKYKFELYEEPKKIRVKCVEAKRSSFTVGKIYEWVDGELKDDYGFAFHLWCQGSDPSAWDFHNYKFELAE